VEFGAVQAALGMGGRLLLSCAVDAAEFIARGECCHDEEFSGAGDLSTRISGHGIPGKLRH
jgi:hypothetical protein